MGIDRGASPTAAGAGAISCQTTRRASPVVSLFEKAKNGAIANDQAGTKRSLSLWQR
jgi:hypothetical protein